MPKKICSDCRMKVEMLYIFKAKTLESDGALRKLLQTTGRGVDKRLNEAQSFINEYQENKVAFAATVPAPTQNVAQNYDQERKNYIVKVPKTPKIDYENEEEYMQVEVAHEEGSIPEEHVEWEYEERFEGEEICTDDPTLNVDSFEQPKKRARVTSRKPPSVDLQMYPIITIARPIPESELILENPPHKFPLRNANQVHDIEIWLNKSTNHQDKIVSLIQQKLNNTSLPQALKKLFDYEIVEHFWHPKGQRRPGGTSITEMRLFNEVFERAVEGIENVDLDELFRSFFKNARNCLRARRSRERHSIRPPSHVSVLVKK